MSFKIDVVTKIIKERLTNYETKSYSYDIGKIISVGDGIAIVSGLDKAMSMELVVFEDGNYGMVMNLEEHFVGVVILGEENSIKEGQVVKRTGRIIEVPVGDGLLGRVVDSLGNPIDDLGEIKNDGYMPIEKVAPGVMSRLTVKQPLKTGIKIIDSLIPIGKGQRELIIGDRQTGKTALAIDTIINQKGQNVKCVYVAIGQKASNVALVREKLKIHNSLSYTTIVMASASSNAPMQFIAPYSGCAIAEYWLNKGEDVLIVYDDLSKHAVSYRTVSLLLRRPPGREAYPGDVFYLHSRLLERACKLNEKHGSGSISALPIIETQAGDISAYIPTNVISITDGQIFLQSELFNKGIRPAVDSGLSVSRVGSNAQSKIIKKLSSSLKLSLAQYNELLSFTQFGSELDSVSKNILESGAKLVELLKQKQYKPLSNEDIALSLFAYKYNFLNDIDISLISKYEEELHLYFKNNHQDIILDLAQDVLNEEEIKIAVSVFTKDFKLKNGILNV